MQRCRPDNLAAPTSRTGHQEPYRESTSNPDRIGICDIRHRTLNIQRKHATKRGARESCKLTRTASHGRKRSEDGYQRHGKSCDFRHVEHATVSNLSATED